MDDRIDPDAWLAQLRTEAAAAARARRGGLGDRLADSATWLGTLVDLAERDGLVVLATTAGRVHRGRIMTIGRDVVVVAPAGETDNARQVVIRISALVWVRPDQALAATGARVGGGFDFAHLLGDLSADRPEVVVICRGAAEPLRGTLRAVGDDVVTITDDARRTVFCNLERVDEVTVLG